MPFPECAGAEVRQANVLSLLPLSIGALPSLRLPSLKNKWGYFVNYNLENLEKDRDLVKEEDEEGLVAP